jgi:hypothetical protein
VIGLTINSLTIPYPDFKYADFINADEFDANFGVIVDKLNEMLTANFGIETGSNTNGNYVKYPDGTMICYYSLTPKTNAYTWVSSPCGGASNYSYWYTSGLTWTYPAAFISAPALTISADIPFVGPESHYVWSDGANPKTRAKYEHGIIANANPGTKAGTAVISVSFTAIGRWK